MTSKALTLAVPIPVLVVVGGVVSLVLAGCPPPVGVDDPLGVIATGTTPNAVTTSRCSGKRVALVTASGDARLDRLPLGTPPVGDAIVDPIDRSSSLFLGVGSAPWDVVVVDDGAPTNRRAVVSLSGSNELVLVDQCAEEILHRVRVETLIPVVPSIRLDTPSDVDGDGIDDVDVQQMLPNLPQGLAARGNDVYATFANILRFSLGGEPMLTGPAALVHIRVNQDRLDVVDLLTLPCRNAGAVAIHPTDATLLAVSCAGRFQQVDGGNQRVGLGGLVVVNVVDDVLTIQNAVELEASPGPVIFDSQASSGDNFDAVVVGDLLDGRVSRYRLTGELVEETGSSGASIESVFALERSPDGALWSGTFSGFMQREPFGATSTFSIQQEGPLRGLVDFVFDDADVDDDPAAPTILGLFTLSAELRRISTEFSFSGGDG